MDKKVEKGRKEEENREEDEGEGKNMEKVGNKRVGMERIQ